MHQPWLSLQCKAMVRWWNLLLLYVRKKIKQQQHHQQQQNNPTRMETMVTQWKFVRTNVYTISGISLTRRALLDYVWDELKASIFRMNSDGTTSIGGRMSWYDRDLASLCTKHKSKNVVHSEQQHLGVACKFLRHFTLTHGSSLGLDRRLDSWCRAWTHSSSWHSANWHE